MGSSLVLHCSSMKRKGQKSKPPVIQMRLRDIDRDLLVKLREKNRTLRDADILRLGLHTLGEKFGLSVS
jgi:hypothetical protein